MARTRRSRVASPESLEHRLLLTVKVKFNPDSRLLKITGDNAANEITLDGLGAQGNFQVFIDGTHFIDFNGVYDIKVNLKGGDDKILINAVAILGEFSGKLGKGADELDADNVINLGSGPDGTVAIASFDVDFGNNPGDLLDFDDQIIVEKKAVFKRVADVDIDADGSGSAFDLNDTIFYQGIELSLSGHGDANSDGFEVDLDNVNSHISSRITGTKSADRLDFSGCRFTQIFVIDLAEGDDSLRIIQNDILGTVEFDGGAGSDTLENLNNVYGIPPSITDFETVV